MSAPIKVDCAPPRGCLLFEITSFINVSGRITIYDPDLTTGCNVKLPIQMDINFQSTPFPAASTPVRVIDPNCRDYCAYSHSREFVLYWPNYVQSCGPAGLISFDVGCCCVNKAGTLYSEFTSLLAPYTRYTVYVIDSDLSRNTFLLNTCIDPNAVAPLVDSLGNYIDYGVMNYTLTPVNPIHTVTYLGVESYYAKTRTGGSDCIALILVKVYSISSTRPPLLACGGVDVNNIEFGIAQIDCFCIGERESPPPPPPSDIFNTKEDFEVMKGLWIGNYAHEEFHDSHIVKRAKVIDII